MLHGPGIASFPEFGKNERSLATKMNKWLLVFVFIFLFLLLFSPFEAQDRVDLFGYNDAQYFGAKVRSRFYQLFTVKLFLDFKGQAAENVTFLCPDTESGDVSCERGIDWHCRSIG